MSPPRGSIGCARSLPRRSRRPGRSPHRTMSSISRPDHSGGEAEYQAAAQGGGSASRTCGPSRRDPAVVDLVADLLGPDIRFHSSKLNFKWSERRRRRALAPGRPGLAAHELRRADLLRLPRRHGPGAGAAHRRAGHASRAAVRAVRRRRPVDGRARRPRRCDPAHRHRRGARGPGGDRRPAPLPRRARLGGQLLVAHAPAAAQRVLGGRRAADHPGAHAHLAHGPARAGARARARAHGAVPCAAPAPLGSGGLPLDLQRSGASLALRCGGQAPARASP